MELKEVEKYQDAYAKLIYGVGFLVMPVKFEQLLVSKINDFLFTPNSMALRD